MVDASNHAIAVEASRRVLWLRDEAVSLLTGEALARDAAGLIADPRQAQLKTRKAVSAIYAAVVKIERTQWPTDRRRETMSIRRYGCRVDPFRPSGVPVKAATCEEKLAKTVVKLTSESAALLQGDAFACRRSGVLVCARATWGVLHEAGRSAVRALDLLATTHGRVQEPRKPGTPWATPGFLALYDRQ